MTDNSRASYLGEARGNSKASSNSLLTERVDLREAIEHGVEAPPELEPGILMAGLTHMIYGPASSGKTWILLYLIARLLERGKRVVYFDSENGKRIIAERLSDLGVDPALLENLYYFPFPSLHIDEKGRERYADLLGEVEPDLVAFDATVNFLASCGLEENSNDDFVKWSTHYTRPARERNIAILLLDHTPHEGGHARGASRKRDEVDVMWAAKCPVPFDRETTETVILRREKDREGWLPKSVVFNIGGTDGYGHIVCARTERPVVEEEDDGGLTTSAHKMLEALREEFGANGARHGEWFSAAKKRGVAKTTFNRTLKTLLLRDRVRVVDGTYFPVQQPHGGGDGGTSGNGSSKAKSEWSHVVPNRSHGTSGTRADGDGPTRPTPLEGGTSGTSAGTTSEPAGKIGGDKRHSENGETCLPAGRAAPAAREGKGQVLALKLDNLTSLRRLPRAQVAYAREGDEVEHQPDRISPSVAARSAPSGDRQPAPRVALVEPRPASEARQCTHGIVGGCWLCMKYQKIHQPGEAAQDDEERSMSNE